MLSYSQSSMVLSMHSRGSSNVFWFKFISRNIFETNCFYHSIYYEGNKLKQWTFLIKQMFSITKKHWFDAFFQRITIQNDFLDNENKRKHLY